MTSAPKESVSINESESLDKMMKDFGENVCKPACQLYKELPQQISEFKRDYILNQAIFNTRMIGLGFATFGVALASWKMNRNILRTLRNTVVGYYGFGVFLAPEIYNPFLFVREVKNE